MICFTPAAKTQGVTPPFFPPIPICRLRSLAMIKAQIIPQRIRKGDGDVASKGIMDENGRAGRRPGL
jgi:hypothetical protein